MLFIDAIIFTTPATVEAKYGFQSKYGFCIYDNLMEKYGGFFYWEMTQEQINKKGIAFFIEMLKSGCVDEEFTNTLDNIVRQELDVNINGQIIPFKKIKAAIRKIGY